VKIVHRWVNCDGCGKRGIEGIRYKCAVCPDFDFCEKCEATVEHAHPFLKIKNLSQTPIRLFADIKGNGSNCPPFSGFMNNGFHGAQSFMRRGMCPFIARQ